MAIAETSSAAPAYPTRIREFRKQRGMTLKELAAQINTTPQTVQRLETDTMTVSMEWLAKIGRALNVQPADLISRTTNRDIQYVGQVWEHGRVTALSPGDTSAYHLDAPFDDPVALRIGEAFGGYARGDVIIANRFRPADIENAVGQNCLVCRADGVLLLRRVIRGRGNHWTLVPFECGEDVQYDQPLAWAARIMMVIRYC